MADIRNYIQNTLLEPLKYYPTAIQDTLLELITEKLETLYNYTVAFPEIVTPTKTRLDILKVIADQFLFTVRDEADLQEQIDILNNILTVYNKRGSIDTIENMWKYYGGDLPRDVQVIVPSYNLFKWSISQYSGIQVFEDGNTNRTGVYEIRLTNSNYDIPKLKDFLIKELVAAGNFIYFTNAISSEIREDRSPSYYRYDITEDNLLHLQLNVPNSYYGLNYSGPSLSVAMSGQYKDILYEYQQLTEEQKASGEYDDIINLYKLLGVPDMGAIWSGKENIFIDIGKIINSDRILYDYLVNSQVEMHYHIKDIIKEVQRADGVLFLSLESEPYSTPSYSSLHIYRDLYNDQGERMQEKIFTLAESNLGEPLGYEPY